MSLGEDERGRAFAPRQSILVVATPEVQPLLDRPEVMERCTDAESARRLLERSSFDLVVWDHAIAGLPDESARRRYSEAGRVGRWLLLGGAVSPSGAERNPDIDYLMLPAQGDLVPGRVEALLRSRALEVRNQVLEARLAAIEECRVLDHCLEAGKVYPLTLDLLLAVTGRTRGVVIFRRTTVPGSYGSAFRGFEDEESERLHRFLVGTKPPDIETYDRMQIVEQGDFSVSFRGAGIQVGALLLVPLRGREGEIGLLCIPEDGRPFGPVQQDLAALVSERASTALIIAENYQLAKERAFIDDVTQVYNARYLLGVADNEIHRAERYGTPLSLLFLDLDRFKQVNDRHGHLTGSETLRNLVGVLKENVREIDTLARYGGDEFAILLGSTSHRDALAIAERVRLSVERHIFEIGVRDKLRLTISIGVASFPAHGSTKEALLETADQAMYRAKSQGRNQICSADELSG